jgi:hypothetical protein
MKPKLILGLALVLSGAFLGCSRTPIPTVESAQVSFSGGTVSNQWSGRTFSEILPPQQIKRILLLDDRFFRNPFLSKPSASIPETQSYFNQLFNHLERSDQKMGVPCLADNELTCAQFAVITSSGDIFHIEALSGMGPGGVAGLLISGHGIETRINVKDFRPSPATNQSAVVTNQPRLAVETDYLLDQKPGDWAGQRFGQIVPSDKIKRIILLEQINDILHYVPETPAVDARQARQKCYDSLFDRFETSNQKAGTNSMTKDECGFAKLILVTDSGEVIYLEIIGVLGRIENGAVVDKHITGVLLHGPGKGVRINVNILPVKKP